MSVVVGGVSGCASPHGKRENVELYHHGNVDGMNTAGTGWVYCEICQAWSMKVAVAVCLWKGDICGIVIDDTVIVSNEICNSGLVLVEVE